MLGILLTTPSANKFEHKITFLCGPTKNLKLLLKEVTLKSLSLLVLPKKLDKENKMLRLLVTKSFKS